MAFIQQEHVKMINSNSKNFYIVSTSNKNNFC